MLRKAAIKSASREGIDSRVAAADHRVHRLLQEMALHDGAAVDDDLQPGGAGGVGGRRQRRGVFGDGGGGRHGGAP